MPIEIVFKYSCDLCSLVKIESEPPSGWVVLGKNYVLQGKPSLKEDNSKVICKGCVSRINAPKTLDEAYGM